MSTLLRDSFDFYNDITDCEVGSAAMWTSALGGAQMSLNSAQTRFGTGQSLEFSTVTGSTWGIFSKSFANNSTIFTGFAMYKNASATTTNGMALAWYDAGTVQCTAYLRPNGDIQFYRGNGSTLLGTFSTGIPAITWTHVQIKVVFSGSVGEFHVRLNGNTADDYSLTSVNNISTANAYANSFALFTVSSVTTYYFDDLWVWSGDATYPYDWLGDFRAVQIMPNADTAQKDFTPDQSSITVGSTVTGSTWSNAANQFSFFQFTPSHGGTLSTSVSVQINANVTGHVVLGIYDSDGTNGAPGTLIAQSSAVTNPTAGANTFTLTSAPTLEQDRNYYWAILQDATTVLKYAGTGSAVPTYYFTNTYSGTLPSTVAGTSFSSTSNRPLATSASLTVTNSGCVNEATQNGGSAYVSDSTVGDYDLYATGGFTVAPAAVLGVSVRSFVAKSDAGARSGAITVKSGSTSQDSSSVILSTSYGNLNMVMDTDPNTSSQWTVSAVNNLQFGPKVAA